jgi:hypothetical protein
MLILFILMMRNSDSEAYGFFINWPAINRSRTDLAVGSFKNYVSLADFFSSWQRDETTE